MSVGPTPVLGVRLSPGAFEYTPEVELAFQSPQSTSRGSCGRNGGPSGLAPIGCSRFRPAPLPFLARDSRIHPRVRRKNVPMPRFVLAIDSRPDKLFFRRTAQKAHDIKSSVMRSGKKTALKVEDLWPEIAKAANTSERLRRTADFFDCCQEHLQSPDRQARYHVFHEISYDFGKCTCDAEVWDWLQEIARSADRERQVDMRIGIFELVPDPPINWSHLFRLWDMWFDPHARWVVYSAYYPFPRRLASHLRRYSAHRRRHRKTIPEFSHTEFNDYIQHA
jgi:hypothetical protein